MTLREAIDIVARECPDGYAQTYARAFDKNRHVARRLGETQKNADRIQISYILSNCATWDNPAVARLKHEVEWQEEEPEE